MFLTGHDGHTPHSAVFTRTWSAVLLSTSFLLTLYTVDVNTSLTSCSTLQSSKVFDQSLLAKQKRRTGRNIKLNILFELYCVASLTRFTKHNTFDHFSLNPTDIRQVSLCKMVLEDRRSRLDRLAFCAICNSSFRFTSWKEPIHPPLMFNTEQPPVLSKDNVSICTSTTSPLKSVLNSPLLAKGFLQA